MWNQFNIASLTLSICFLTPQGFAQEPPTDLLSGPSIESEEVSEKDTVERRMNEQGVKVNNKALTRLWIKAMESMDLESTQKTAFREAMAEYRAAQKTFHDQYGKEMQELRKKSREVKRAVEDSASNDKRPNLSNQDLTRLTEMAGMAPDVSVYQEKIWVTLTSDQQAEFRTIYEILIDEEKKEAAEKQDKNNRSKGVRPMMDDMNEGSFAPKDSKFRNRDINPEDDPKERHGDALDESSLKRIKFLRRLQNLKND